jgi:hypothetical protein
MRGRVVRVAGLSAAALCLVLACGARTGIYLESAPADAGVPVDGHLLDVVTECNDPPFCRKDDPGFVYKCGVRIEQCGSLEQCEDSCGDASGAGEGDACAAGCVNPCRDTLGQNTSNGCEFYAAEMDLTDSAKGACYAVFVVNQWQTGQPAKLEVDLGGTILPIEQFARIPTGTGTNIVYSPFVEAEGLAKNQVAILFLSRDPQALTDPVAVDPRVLANCPPGITPAIVGDAALHGTGIGTAFHLVSNVPIVAYQMLPYGGGHARVTGATLLLPTNVWGTNYIAANAYSFPAQIAPLAGDARAGPTMAILAQEDGTHVTIDPVAPIVAAGGLAGTASQAPITYTIDKGQYLQFTQPNELTGSPIQSDRPVAVIGGATLMDIPVTLAPLPVISRADSAEQMLPPVSALGSEYVAVRYRSRDPAVEESTRWRIVGAVDGTMLTYDPAPPPGAPLGINQGELEEIDDPGLWVVSSQDSNHPFYFAQYMTGGGDLSNPDLQGAGDPEFVNVIAPQQYLPRYTFFTDPTYPETNLVVVASKDPLTNQFPTVNLDCAGTLTGWQPVGILGKYQFTRIDLSTGNYEGQNGCNNGVHTIEASLPGSPLGNAAMGVTIWGWGTGATGPACNAKDPAVQTDPNFTCWVSYAYPAGANITKLNDVVVPAN